MTTSMLDAFRERGSECNKWRFYFSSSCLTRCFRIMSHQAFIMWLSWGEIKHYTFDYGGDLRINRSAISACRQLHCRLPWAWYAPYRIVVLQHFIYRRYIYTDEWFIANMGWPYGYYTSSRPSLVLSQAWYMAWSSNIDCHFRHFDIMRPGLLYGYGHDIWYSPCGNSNEIIMLHKRKRNAIQYFSAIYCFLFDCVIDASDCIAF